MKYYSNIMPASIGDDTVRTNREFLNRPRRVRGGGGMWLNTSKLLPFLGFPTPESSDKRLALDIRDKVYKIWGTGLLYWSARWINDNITHRSA